MKTLRLSEQLGDAFRAFDLRLCDRDSMQKCAPSQKELDVVFGLALQQGFSTPERGYIGHFGSVVWCPVVGVLVQNDSIVSRVRQLFAIR